MKFFTRALNYKVQPMKDQFINAPLLVHRQPQSINEKNETIKALELKNYKLRTQLLKIQRAIQLNQDEQLEIDIPKKRESIFEWQQSEQVLTKQLTNSYKKIKMYEYQISKLQKDYQDKIAMKQKVKQTQIIIKEKKIMNERLKQQFIKQQKATQQNMKKLENNHQHEESEIYLKRLNEEITFYKEKLAIFEKKELIKIKNMKRQYQTLKQVENHLLEIGLAGGELQQIKRLALKNVKSNKKSVSQTHIRKQASNFTNLEEDQIEDRTQEYYETILGQINLLSKMQKDHEKQIAQAEIERQQATSKNNNLLTKLSQCEREIQNLEKEITNTKNKVIPSNLKPINIRRSVSSYQGENINKIEPLKQPQKPKSNRIGHLLKFQQVGFLSVKGQRFTDRNLLGKYNIYAKITGIKIFIERISGIFGGIQVAYDGQKGGEYVKKDKQAKGKQYIEQQYICKENNSIKSISGTLNRYSQIQSLLVTSSDGTKHKFGTSKNNQKQFNFSVNPEQHPTCLFGSLIISRDANKREVSYIQHLGFQVQSINFSSQSAINLMSEQIHQ